MRCKIKKMTGEKGCLMERYVCPDMVTFKCCCVCEELKSCVNKCRELTNKPLPVKI